MPSPFHKEIIRKSIHTAGVLFLPLLFQDRSVFIGLFAFFLVVYFLAEFLNHKKIEVPFLTSVIRVSKRHHESERWARGPVFLSLSCILTPILFPAQVACLGLMQVFVSDSAAAIVGMKWGMKWGMKRGRLRIPFAPEKSWEGTAAYFATAFFLSLLWSSPLEALALATAGSFLEMVSGKDWDNVTIPLGIASLASWIL